MTRIVHYEHRYKRPPRKKPQAAAIEVPRAKPPDAQVVTSLWLPPELMLGLKSLAVRERKTVNDLIVEAIKKHLALRQPL